MRSGFELCTHQLVSARRGGGEGGGVPSGVEGSCARGGENNAKGEAECAVKGGESAGQ